MTDASYGLRPPGVLTRTFSKIHKSWRPRLEPNWCLIFHVCSSQRPQMFCVTHHWVAGSAQACWEITVAVGTACDWAWNKTTQSGTTALGMNTFERGKKNPVWNYFRGGFQLQNGSERVEPRRREPWESGSRVCNKDIFLKRVLTILLIHNLENYIPIFTEENEISHLTKTTNKILFELKLTFL